MAVRVLGSRRGVLLALGAGLLAGCGFKPLYGPRDAAGGAAQDRLAEVNVLLIPERNGQLLRQALQARLERSGADAARRYDLSVQLAVSAEPIAVQQDSSITRVRLIATANWALLSQSPQRSTLTSGSAREVDGFDIINQQFFASELMNAATQRRMTDALAEQITTKLAVYFARQTPA
jgi:LPS-assembly lipoprotein